MDKHRVCCFTGHRKLSNEDLSELAQKLDRILEKLIGKGVVCYGSGGAIGFDTMAALAVLRQRMRNSSVKLIMVLPCQEQAIKWMTSDKITYNHLLSVANKVVYVSESYYNGCMTKRNKYLVENSNTCIAYMKHKRSGTAQTVRFARAQGLNIINLADCYDC